MRMLISNVHLYSVIPNSGGPCCRSNFSSFENPRQGGLKQRTSRKSLQIECFSLRHAQSATPRTSVSAVLVLIALAATIGGRRTALTQNFILNLLSAPPAHACLQTNAGDYNERIPNGRRKKSNAFIRIAAAQVGPAVVRLDTERSALVAGQRLCDSGEPFEPGSGNHDFGCPQRAFRERGQGSGFVIDGKRGLIVTNAHVVKGADRVKVTFTDGRIFEGELTGIDDITDLAVVKVQNEDGDFLPVAPLGDSRTVELGDWVIAVGNPFGLDNTISLGIISNLCRTAAEVGMTEKRLDLFQTDCAINPGNSGGPLANEFGEVIAINTAIRADAEGIAFAIPINYVTTNEYASHQLFKIRTFDSIVMRGFDSKVQLPYVKYITSRWNTIDFPRIHKTFLFQYIIPKSAGRCLQQGEHGPLPSWIKKLDAFPFFSLFALFFVYFVPHTNRFKV